MVEENKIRAWLLVAGETNWNIAMMRGVFGLEHTPGRIQKIKKGDLYVAYQPAIGFVGYGKVESSYYEGGSRMWEDKLYRHRFNISNQKSGNILPGGAIKDYLSFIINKKKWGMYFRNGVMEIPMGDYKLIINELEKSNTSITEIEEDQRISTSKDIGDSFHDRMKLLFQNAGFSIIKSSYTDTGPDIIIEDPSAQENSRILVQCRNTSKKNQPTYTSLQGLVDDYAYKRIKDKAVVSIIALGGYKTSEKIDSIEILEKDRVAIWTESIIEYYEDLSEKISGFSRYQILADLGLNLKYADDVNTQAVLVNQNNYKLYAFPVNPDWLLRAASVVRRIDYSGKVVGYQRLLDKSRIILKDSPKSIPQYLESDEWIFPNAIICTSKIGTNLNYDNGKLKIPSRYGTLWVIDGQHRLYSFANSPIRSDTKNQLLCVVLDSKSLGEDAGEIEARQANIFAVLNGTARKVDKALIFELHKVLGIKNTALEVVFMLADTDTFKGSIKGYLDKNGSISLVTFATTAPIKRLAGRKSPFVSRINQEESEIRDICFKELRGFFKAIERTFNKEWHDPENYILKTDRGIRGLLRLYERIIKRYGFNKNLDSNINDVIIALYNSGFDFSIKGLRGKYLGEGGADDLVLDLCKYIAKEIPDFDPEIKVGVVLEIINSPLLDFEETKNKLANWFKRLDGDVRGQVMFIDPTTIELLSLLDSQKVQSVRIFFGNVGDENKTKKAIGEFKGSYNAIFTRAQKKSLGGLFHTRWIGNNKFQILLDQDLKEQSIANSIVVYRLIQWKDPWEIVEFDRHWTLAEGGVKFDYDWGEQT